MQIVTTVVTWQSLKATLSETFGDNVAGAKKKMVWPKYMEVGRMADAWEDDLEHAGPGLASEKAEAQDIAVGTILEGYATRYLARTFGLRLIVSEEAIEDNKYPQVINAAGRLVHSAIKTQEYDCANLLIRAANSNFTGGDGQPLASESHPLPGGGTYSNMFNVAQSPSRQALQIASTNLSKMPSSGGLIEGYLPLKLLCPVDQRFDWEQVLMSQYEPESGNNAINPAARMGIELVPIPYWTDTTPWGLTTDAGNGLRWLWRRKIRNRTYIDEDAEVLKYSITYRCARGWSNPRAFYFSNA